MLERLRRQRGDTPHAAPNTNRATVVLETLSGRKPEPPRHRGLLLTGLILLAGIAVVVLYVTYQGHIPARPERRSVTRTGAPLPPPGITIPPATTSEFTGERARGGTVPGERDLTHTAQSRSVEVGAKSEPKAGRSDVAFPAVTPPPVAAEKLRAGTAERTQPDDADDHFRRALAYHRSGDFENALIEYTSVLQRNEMHVEAHNNLGLLYQTKGLADEAIREFTTAIGIDPSYAQARNNLGVALLQAGKVDAAIAEFQSLLRTDARNVGAMVNLAIAQRAAGRPGEAQETLIRAICIDGRSAAAHYNLASLYEDAGEFAKALEYYERYLTLAGADEAKRMAEVRQRCQILRQRIMQQQIPVMSLGPLPVETGVGWPCGRTHASLRRRRPCPAGLATS